eukprot:4682165-Pleurochrysis_carterae.AAC.1
MEYEQSWAADAAADARHLQKRMQSLLTLRSQSICLPREFERFHPDPWIFANVPESGRGHL